MKDKFLPFLDVPDSVLCRTLASFKGRRITCLMNKGNCGDGLIHMGGRRLLQTLGLEYEEIVHPAQTTGDVLLAYGAGNLVRKAWGMAYMLQQYLGAFRQIVILPATIDVECKQVVALFEMLPQNAIVFCREAFSYRTTAERFPSLCLHLSHDLAFHADLGAWASRPHSGTTSVYRLDSERRATKKPIVGDLFDASNGTQDEPDKLLNHVSRYSVVHTDRTHGAISSAIMGREVHLYANAYFKNRAIFEHSLRHFPNVHYVEARLDLSALIKDSAFKAYQTVRSVDRRTRTATGIFAPKNS
jgi:exopolysaccharide biosynthesis predicted pyruvyltransferase EpsI